MSRARIKVLVVDDSAVVRETFSALLGAERDIGVIGAAADPYEAVAIMREVKPDVITLDVEMPRMDGLTFLAKVMDQHPLPVVVCSSLARSGSRIGLKAFEFGAVEVVAKPANASAEELAEVRILLCDAVRAAARAGCAYPGNRDAARIYPTRARPAGTVPLRPSRRVVVAGASTGGTEALPALLRTLPAETAGVAVVQHMPEYFTFLFAERLNGLCAMEVKEAADGDAVLDGRILLAPGGRHMLLRRGAAGYFVEVRPGPLVSRHRPSVDVLFRSAAEQAGADAVGVILTGMGDDGARGMRQLRNAGARTFAQDESSCVVYGMPGEAVRHGGVEQTLPLAGIGPAVLRALAEPKGRPRP